MAPERDRDGGFGLFAASQLVMSAMNPTASLLRSLDRTMGPWWDLLYPAPYLIELY